jgi:inosine-uridine nucleoside N-ribohydrolase
MDVIFVQDAAIDEYMAQVLLATMPVNLLGVVIVNADCIDSAAMQTAWKVESFIDATTPLGLSRARGWNAFPWPYRGDCVKMGGIGIFCNTSCPIVEFPLDMTNQAAVAPSFMAQLQAQATAGSRWSQLAYESYGIVASEAFYDMWDVATTCWLVNSQENIFAPPSTLKLSVHVELDGSQGCIKEDENGRVVQVVFSFAQPGGASFYQYVAKQLNR